MIQYEKHSSLIRKEPDNICEISSGLLDFLKITIHGYIINLKYKSMKKYSQLRNKGKKTSFFVRIILLLFILFTANLSQTLANEALTILQSTNVTIDLSNQPLSVLFKALEKESKYVFFYKDDVFTHDEKISIKADNESVVSILNKVLTPRNLGFTVKGRQVVVVSLDKAPGMVNKTTKVQEDYQLKGQVVDVNGDPLPGVNITLQETTVGAITDLDGQFSLDVKDGKRALLVASYIGFGTKKIWVDENTGFLKIELKETAASLNEVVVVGYGTQKKLNLTGAVTTASGDILENRPIGNIAQGLQGMVPNLNITFNSGQPNQAAQINIRGNTSLNGGNALILVDGVEISDLSLINPQDVESVSVLKDASAAAVYGARAAFGVMLVTTKKGNRNQKTRVNYSNNFSWSSPARLPEMPRSDVWVRMWNKAYAYDTPGGYYFNDKFLKYLDAHIADPKNNPAILVDTEGIQNSNYNPSNPGWAYVGNTNWLEEFYRNSAFMQQHNASISGGTERNNYYASIGFKDQSGIFRYGNDTYKRFNLSFNFDTKLTKWLDMSFSTRLSNIQNDEPYMDNGGSDAQTWYYEVYCMFPTLSIYLPNGDFAGLYLNSGNFNIIGKMALAGRNKKKTWDQWYTGRFDLHPIKGLSIKGDYSWNRYSTVQKFHRKEMTQTFPEGGPQYTVETPNYVKNYNSNNIYQAFNIWAEYKKSFNEEHNISVMAGYNQEEKKYNSTAYTMTDLYNNDLPVSDLAINYKNNDETDDIWRVQGAFFRLNYDYKSKYLMEVNGRYDGSSKYAKHDRWAFFPSASIGWRISEEKFFKPLKGVVDNLKIRASIGALGNQVTDGYHSYMSTLKGKVLNNYMMGGKVINALDIPTLPSLVTWEKVISKDIGLDWSLFNNRFTGTFDFYVRDTKDMVRSVTLPAVLGTSGGKENVADMRTVGWEVELTWKDRLQNVLGSPLDYSFTVGLSDYQAEITKFDNPNGSLSMYYKGYKFGEIWGYVTDGFIQDEFEADRMNYVQKFISSKWYPGDIRYKDLNGDGVINNGTVTLDDPGDKKIIGNSTPRYRFNLQGSIGWHGFDIRAIFEGVGKRDMWTSSDIFWGFSRGIYNSCVTQYHIDNTWTYENTNAYYPRLTGSANNRSKQVQSKYLQNAAYIRLKDITVSYNVPKKWLSKLKIEQARVYVSGLNLWEKTGLPPFMTPDIVDQMTGPDVKLMSENSGKEYAFMRSLSFGVNLTF